MQVKIITIRNYLGSTTFRTSRIIMHLTWAQQDGSHRYGQNKIVAKGTGITKWWSQDGHNKIVATGTGITKWWSWVWAEQNGGQRYGHNKMEAKGTGITKWWSQYGHNNMVATGTGITRWWPQALTIMHQQYQCSCMYVEKQ